MDLISTLYEKILEMASFTYPHGIVVTLCGVAVYFGYRNASAGIKIHTEMKKKSKELEMVWTALTHLKSQSKSFKTFEFGISHESFKKHGYERVLMKREGDENYIEPLDALPFIIHLSKNKTEAFHKLNFNVKEKEKFNSLLASYFMSMGSSRLLWVFSACLLRSIFRRIEESETKEAAERNTVIGIMLSEKADKLGQTVAITVLFLSVIVASVGLGVFKFSWTPIAVALYPLIFAAISQRVLEWRIDNGRYGTSPYEAKEIIAFICKYKNKDDFTSGGKPKKIFPKTKWQEDVPTGLKGEAVQ